MYSQTIIGCMYKALTVLQDELFVIQVENQN